MKPSGLGLLFLGTFLTTIFISMLMMGLLGFLYLPGSVLEGYTFLRIHRFLLSCPFYYHIVKKEIKICIETNENENTTGPNLWDSVKAMQRRFIAIQAYLKKLEKKEMVLG